MKNETILFVLILLSQSAGQLYAQTTYRTCAWIIPSALSIEGKIVRFDEKSGVRQDTFPDDGLTSGLVQHWSESCICNAQNEIIFYTDVLDSEWVVAQNCGATLVQ